MMLSFCRKSMMMMMMMMSHHQCRIEALTLLM